MEVMDYHIQYRHKRINFSFIVVLFPLALFILGFAVYLQNSSYPKVKSNPNIVNKTFFVPITSPTEGIQVGVGGGPQTKTTLSPTPSKTFGPAY